MDEYPNFITYDDYFLFCNTVGIPAKKDDYNGIGFRNFIDVLRTHRESANDFISHYIAMVNCINGGREQDIIRNIIIGALSRSHIPDSELVFLKGNHFIAYKHPDEFNRAVLQFLRN
ncbi:MAG: hypothetical protein K6G63_10615 [Eubacterium sp.]|nr:hypothetical protein [Eubacterium sp.]